ncbi:MAG TPA: DNA recombination protein RmuC, partial [Bryobacteraceae bacterium]|nr:DNA recombination protein RmuC [Bryobacteraceae bacterium]
MSILIAFLAGAAVSALVIWLYFRRSADLVSPIHETLEEVQKRLQDLEVSRASAHATLSEQVRSLADAQKHLHAETGNLVKA